MNNSKLSLRSINQILEERFFVPAYQSGYRWTETQVIQLLDDLWSFAQNPPLQGHEEEKPFYCLQSVVVKRQNDSENEWEVIDGKQRLTTIVLILHYFNEMWLGNYKITEPPVSYETRQEIENFISNLEIDKTDKVDFNSQKENAIHDIKLKNNSEFENNIDFYHIAKAYKSIHYWVQKKGAELDNNKMQSVFKHDTKVIWYEAQENDSNHAIDIFTRLNIGKIPLTNAELIKALFLQKGNFSEEKASLKQIKIASEWENIERTLQDDAFWYFIYNPKNPLNYENRIEYIFDLMKDRDKDSDHYHTFNEFYKEFLNSGNGEKPDIDKIWLKFKRYFLTIEEWFKHHYLFHYIGFLIDEGYPVKNIKKISER
ncbi:MAG: DUF262 domain-containing protein [Bacteroidales bacterium]|nr:DUF262 domain-containing protein [Bacteroidales bacterium]